MRSGCPGVPRAAAVFLAPVLLLACVASGASAQDTADLARLRLVSIPVAHGPSDDLDVKLEVANLGRRTLDGFDVTVGASGIIRNRTELHTSFAGAATRFALTLGFPNERIAPGERRQVRIDPPVADLVGLESEGGVHALSFSLSAEDGLAPLDTLTTQLLTYPTTPENRLTLVPLLPLNEGAARAPDGSYPVGVAGQNWLEAAVAEGGWLSAVVNALDGATEALPEPEPEPQPEGRRDERGRRDDRRPQRPAAPPPPDPLQVALAPTPRLVEELAALADGYARSLGGELEDVPQDAPGARAAARVLSTLRETMARDVVQPVLVPYSFPDLPTLEEKLTAGDVGLQLTEGITAIDEALGVRLDRRWVFPPAGRLDAASLQALQTAGVTDGVFFAGDALEGPDDPADSGCPVAVLSFVCSVTVETDIGGPIAGYVFDVELQRRLSEMAQPSAGRLEMQRVLAETAMVHAEQPGTTGRVLHLSIPSSWHPRPKDARAFFDALRNAPWLTTRTPSSGLADAGTPKRRTLVDNATPLPLHPDDAYFADIVTTQDIVESFSTFVGQREQRDMLERLRRNILIAQGRSLWSEPDGLARAASYARDARAEAEQEMGKVELGVPAETTFTSRTGSLGVSLFNQTEYPIEAKVVLESLDMEFSPATIERTFPQGTTRLSVEAEAQTSGTFPIEVRVETVDGFVVATEAVQVRSTEFNVVALTITLGAVAFLISFYLSKLIRRRRRRSAEAPAS